jgi:YggT family protein
MPLADSISTAQDFVGTLKWVYIALILAYILLSWIPVPYTVWGNRIQRFLYDVVEPYLRLFRRFLPQLGGFGLDLSPILGIVTLLVLDRVIWEGLELLR